MADREPGAALGAFGAWALTAAIVVMAAPPLGAVGPRGSGCDPVRPATCTLRELAGRSGVRIGATLEPEQTGEPAYAETLSREFSAITPENAMKWYATQAERGEFTFDGADAIVDFAEAHDMTVRGHALVWAQDRFTPGWVREITDPDELWAEVVGQVDAVMGRYRGRVHRYDVLNEPLASTGSGPSDSVFHRVLGPGWIGDLFRHARAADPTAELWLNEFGSDFQPAKHAALVELVRGLLADGVPIDGVGVQTHRFSTAGPERGAFEGMLRDFTAMGVQVAVTELDVATDPEDPGAFAAQAGAYDRIVRSCLAVEGCVEVTTWGVTDAATWLDGFDFLAHPTRPLLFDEAFAPKPAYESVRRALADRVVGAPPSTSIVVSSTVPGAAPPTDADPAPSPAAPATPLEAAATYTG